MSADAVSICKDGSRVSQVYARLFSSLHVAGSRHSGITPVALLNGPSAGALPDCPPVSQLNRYPPPPSPSQRRPCFHVCLLCPWSGRLFRSEALDNRYRVCAVH